MNNNARGNYSLIYTIDCIVDIDAPIFIRPNKTNGAIKYPTNKTIIGAKPNIFPIIPFLLINCSFDCFLFSL